MNPATARRGDCKAMTHSGENMSESGRQQGTVACFSAKNGYPATPQNLQGRCPRRWCSVVRDCGGENHSQPRSREPRELRSVRFCGFFLAGWDNNRLQRHVRHVRIYCLDGLGIGTNAEVACSICGVSWLDSKRPDVTSLNKAIKGSRVVPAEC